MKFTEIEIQDYIWKNREDWEDFFYPVGVELPTDELSEEEIISLGPEDLLYRIVTRRIIDIYESTTALRLFGVEVGLKKQNDSTIRVDFMGSIEGDVGIGIIELKKSNQTSREAFTELLAYSSHVNTKFPSHCVDDLILVLISPLKVRTVREAYLQSLLFDEKRIVALELVFEDEDDIGSLKFKLFLPSRSDIAYLTRAAFLKRNFDVEVTVWTEEYIWNAYDSNNNPKENVIANMNSLTAYAAQVMERKNIHGFVYTQQSFKEMPWMYPNSIVVVGLNPYQIANCNDYVQKNPDIKAVEIPEVGDYGPSLRSIIPGLDKPRNMIEEDENHLVWLNMTWGVHLSRVGKECVDFLSLSSTNKTVLTDRGSSNWEHYESSLIENAMSHNFYVRPTGIIRKMFSESLKLDYKYFKDHGVHPLIGDVFEFAVESTTSHYLFSQFIERMLGEEE